MTIQALGPRLAVRADVPALVRVVNRAYAIERFFVEGERTSEDEIGERLARPHAAFLVVDDGARPSALAAAVYVEVRGDRGYFAMLSVDPRRQGSGLGRLLVTATEDHCRAAGAAFLDIEVVNLRSELPAFYTRLGFAAYATAPFPSPHRLTRHAHLVLMTKPLVALWK